MPSGQMNDIGQLFGCRFHTCSPVEMAPSSSNCESEGAARFATRTCVSVPSFTLSLKTSDTDPEMRRTM